MEFRNFTVRSQNWQITVEKSIPTEGIIFLPENIYNNENNIKLKEGCFLGLFQNFAQIYFGNGCFQRGCLLAMFFKMFSF